jgi:hypothetical protein
MQGMVLTPLSSSSSSSEALLPGLLVVLLAVPAAATAAACTGCHLAQVLVPHRHQQQQQGVAAGKPQMMQSCTQMCSFTQLQVVHQQLGCPLLGAQGQQRILRPGRVQRSRCLGLGLTAAAAALLLLERRSCQQQLGRGGVRHGVLGLQGMFIAWMTMLVAMLVHSSSSSSSLVLSRSTEVAVQAGVTAAGSRTLLHMHSIKAHLCCLMERQKAAGFTQQQQQQDHTQQSCTAPMLWSDRPASAAVQAGALMRCRVVPA